MADLNTDIRYIKGVGEARAKAFEKLGVFTLGDLIAYYPRRWEDRSQLYPIRDLPEGEYACCKAMIAQPPTAARIRGGQTLVQVRAVDEGGVLELHLRDDATTFNPFALDTSRASRDEDFDMDGMGVLVIKKRAKEFFYRRYQGFNTLIIKI